MKISPAVRRVEAHQPMECGSWEGRLRYLQRPPVAAHSCALSRPRRLLAHGCARLQKEVARSEHGAVSTPARAVLSAFLETQLHDFLQMFLKLVEAFGLGMCARQPRYHPNVQLHVRIKFHYGRKRSHV